MEANMKAIRIQPAPQGSTAYSPSNPAPPSAIFVNLDAPTPKITKPGEILVQVKTTTVIRDNLTWPELYFEDAALLGNDYAGTVAAVHPDEQNFKPGDEVYGMTSAHRGGAWAEYIVVTQDEICPKPQALSWEDAAALPLSGMTADQALFEHADLKTGVAKEEAKRVLITGAAGGVGMLLVQMAAGAGHFVIAASSSRTRDEELLTSFGASELVEYRDFESVEPVDVVIDTVGGEVLKKCWKIVKTAGSLVSIDSSSWDFVKEHNEKGLSKGKEQVKAKFFIVEPSKESMKRVTEAVGAGRVKIFVAKTFPLNEAKEAYELVESGKAGRGKVILIQ